MSDDPIDETAMSDDQWFEWVWTKRRVFTEMPERPWRFSPGDRVRVDFPARDDQTAPAWYRAVVIGPSTQRAGDFFVRVIEASPNSGVKVGARLSPIIFGGVDLVIDPD